MPEADLRESHGTNPLRSRLTTRLVGEPLFQGLRVKSLCACTNNAPSGATCNPPAAASLRSRKVRHTGFGGHCAAL